MHIYLAGPMSGYPEHNYPAFFEAERALSAPGDIILNPARNEEQRLDDGRKWASWSWYMRQSLKQIAECDVIVVLPEWETSRGATLEVSLAGELGIPVITLDHWQAGIRPSDQIAARRTVRDEMNRIWFADPTQGSQAWIMRGSQETTIVHSLRDLDMLHGPLVNNEDGTPIVLDDTDLDHSIQNHPAGGTDE